MALSDELLAVLNDPTRMWSHALRELSHDSQRLFLMLTLLPKPVPIAVLRTAHSAQMAGASEPFFDSLRSIEDSFIKIDRSHSKIEMVNFRNPSLQDFASSYLDGNSDWLDVLLESPRFFDQIIGVFTLAMTQRDAAALPRKWQRPPMRKESYAKYPEVRDWVDHESARLIELATDLLDGDSARLYPDEAPDRINRLLEIMKVYGMSETVAGTYKLRSSVEAALDPSSEYAAGQMMDLFDDSAYRELLDRVVKESSLGIMRRNVLNNYEDWRFKLLYRLDSMLGISRRDSWDTWGSDYIGYAYQMAADLEDSDSRDDLRDAIAEMNDISEMLGINLSQEIAGLEGRRDSLPVPRDDYDEDEDDQSDNEAKPRGYDSSAELDRIFQSLL